jgi:hypothetical protein
MSDQPTQGTATPEERLLLMLMPFHDGGIPREIVLAKRIGDVVKAARELELRSRSSRGHVTMNGLRQALTALDTVEEMRWWGFLE